MKKSEAIRKLTEHLKAQLRPDGEILCIDTYELLDFIEKEIGMAPPEYYDFEMVSEWEAE